MPQALKILGGYEIGPKGSHRNKTAPEENGAGEGIRTLGLFLGKEAL